MSYHRYKGIYIGWVILLICCVVTEMMQLAVKKKKTTPPADTDNVALPYRTMYAADTGHHLIAYEFHKFDAGDQRYIECSAIIRSMDPSKDNYKAYCKSVIEDIERTMGTERIELTVYDDYEAYQLAEIKAGQQFKVLDKKETDTVDKHTVATYCGKIDEYTGTHTLMFYPDTHDRYTAKEIYEPSE